jgi:hypothetical protein
MPCQEVCCIPSFLSDAWPAGYERHWFRAERQEANVIKIDQLAALVNLGRALAAMQTAMNQRLRARDGTQVLPRLLDVSQQCYQARSTLAGVLADEVMPLKDCKKSAERLIEAISAMIAGPNVHAHGQETLNAYFSGPLLDALADFYGDLALELGSIPVYFATKKRGYDRDVLLNTAEELLDASDLNYLSAFTIQDLRKAGACLMFDLFTASGFHSARAVEAVARQYYESIFGKPAIRIGSRREPEPLGLGALAMELSDRFSNLKKAKTDTGLLGSIANTLERIARLYRNPIMHPEVILDEKNSVRIFGETINAISTMIEDLRAGGMHFTANIGTAI